MKWLNKIWARIVRFGFRLLYNEFAWTYDGVARAVSLGEWGLWQRASLTFLPDPFDAASSAKILEIGHGPGHMLLETGRRGFDVIGCDLSPFMGRMAQARLQKNGVPAALVRGAVPQLPFADGTFDVVLSQFPTTYILETETATAVWRLLKPGGRLIVLPEGHLTGGTAVHRFISWLFRITGQTAPAAEDDAAALWKPWRTHYEAAGFAVDVHTVALRRSVCTVLTADKPAISSPA